MTARVLVTGSRTWRDRAAVTDALDGLLAEHGALTVVHGACPTGADAMAHKWALNGRMILRTAAVSEPHPPDWQRHGKRAGVVRNAEMVALGADVCLAFIRDSSPGASNCALLARRAGIPVQRYTA